MKVISGRAFAERFALNPSAYAWLLGAGASAAAGIPTGYQMIQDFRARLFASETGVSLREVDTSDPVWLARIDEHHARQGRLPRKGDPEEYSRAFEALHKTIEDRRLYIRNKVSQGSPSLGHKVLGALLSSRKALCVFTTNFDTLVEEAATVAAQFVPASNRARATVAALDNTSRATTALADNDWPLIVKLHGDYQSVKLKNISEELKRQDAEFLSVLKHAVQRFGLLVVGYSGRDDSVMEALRDGLRQPNAFPSGIYWLCPDPEALLPAVRSLMEQAAAANVEFFVIEGTTFDELTGDIADLVDLPKTLADHVFGDRSSAAPVKVHLPREPALRAPVLRLTAVPLEELPLTARALSLQKPATILEVRALLKASGVFAAVTTAGSSQTLAAFGPDQGLLSALASLGPSIAGEVALDPIRDSWAKGLLYDALVRSLCQWKPLHARLSRRGHSIQVSEPRKDLPPQRAQERQALLAKLKGAYEAELTGPVKGTSGTYAEGFETRLELADGRWWFTFDPMTFIDLPFATTEGDKAQAAAAWRRRKNGGENGGSRRRNAKWAELLDAWVELFTVAKGRTHSAYSLAAGSGVDAVFKLGARSARSRPAHDHDHFHLRRTSR
jgi:hypothetical protein